MRKFSIVSLIFYFSLQSFALALGENQCAQSFGAAPKFRGELYTLNGNPLLRKSDAPFGAPRYDLYQLEQVIPAYELSLDEYRKHLASIRDNKEAPSFQNTILALEKSPLGLSQAQDYMFMLDSANKTPEYTTVSKITRKMSGHFSAQIFSDKKLFARVKAVYDQRSELNLSSTEVLLVEQTYHAFENSGMTLLVQEDGEAKFTRKTEILREISNLSSQFSQNINQFRDTFRFRINREEDLAGIPDHIVALAKQNAIDAGKPDAWIFMNRDSSSSYIMPYAESSEIRERFYRSSLFPEDFPNYEIIKNIAKLRHELALLLGYNNFTEMVLEGLMAGHPQKVNELVDPLAEKALELARTKRKEFISFYKASGGKGEIQAWEISYWIRLFSNHKFSYDPETIKDYFPFEKVFEGTLEHFSDSYNIDFISRDDIPAQHEDARAYEVRSRKTGEALGVMYFDLFKRDKKNGGAHQVRVRAYKDFDGKIELPLIRIVTNFDSPTKDKPSLLSIDQVETLFHELGHGMDSLFSRAGYPALSRLVFDAIEVPSQAQEGFVKKREVLDRLSAHKDTGEPLTDDLLEKALAYNQFFKSFNILSQITQIKLDFAWHSEEGTFVEDVEAFENKISAPYRVNPKVSAIPGESVSVTFMHIFAMSYASKYYSYLWSDILAAHIFHRLSRHPIYSDEYREDFEDFVNKFLFYGQTRSVLDSFIDLIGEEPDVTYLLKDSGLE